MHLNIQIGALGDPMLFKEYSDSQPSELVGFGILENGMESGAVSCCLIIETGDKKHFAAQLSGGMLLAMAAAVKGAKERFGDYS